MTLGSALQSCRRALSPIRRRFERRRDQLDAARAGRRWAHEARSFYARFVHEGSLCFDIGANVGNRSSIFLSLGARVVAVEPQPACAAALRSRFGSTGRIEVVEAALGAEAGRGELLLAPYDTVATLSRGWIDSVREAGRFRFEWNEKRMVAVTTLDALIEQYGVPAFLKIDVEGYEREVLAGLTRAVPAVSFEVTPEFVDAGVECVRRLSALGLRRFSFSTGESLVLGPWLDEGDVVQLLAELPHDGRLFGDVYAVVREPAD